MEFGQRGQIVVEYMLLLAIGVIVAFTISSVMVNRSTQSPGFLVAKWLRIIQVIGADQADDIQR